MPAVASLAIQ